MFVQWEDLRKKVEDVLDDYGFTYEVLQGNVMQKKNKLHRFKHEDVNILIMSFETAASGTNLTEASHVFFVNPMNAANLDSTVAQELQAVGRVRRYGQTRSEITIWKFLSLNTVETEMFKQAKDAKEERERQKANITRC